MAFKLRRELEQPIFGQWRSDQRVRCDERANDRGCAAAKTARKRYVAVHRDRKLRHGYARFLEYHLSYFIDQIRLVCRNAAHLITVHRNARLACRLHFDPCEQ
ncbi:hypothetical protein D3C84_962450 [compost metagenome]